MGKLRIKLKVIPPCKCGRRPEMSIGPNEFYAVCLICECPSNIKSY